MSLMSPELVGRQAEMRAVRQLLKQSTSGKSRWIQIFGEPGIGKTRLVSEISETAEGLGCLVLNGRGGELEGGLPFGIFVDALDDYLGGLQIDRLKGLAGAHPGDVAGVFPSLTAVAPPTRAGLSDERYSTYRAVRGLLENLASHRPLVLLLDDIHWADESSRQLVAFLLHRPPRAGLLLGLSWRPGRAPELATEFAAAGHDSEGVRIELGPLGDADARALLGRRVSPEEMHVCGGNPFYLLQIARSAGWPDGSRGLPRGPLADGTIRVAGLPPAVSLAVANEVAAVSPAARQLGQAAAVVGEPFEPRMAAVAADLAEADALDALDELVAAQIIRQTDQPTRFRFRQPIVREAVYGTAAPGWRLGAHRRLADALAAERAPATVRARHVALTAVPGDEEAIAVLTEAARETQSRAPASSAEWWQDTLRLLPRGTGEKEVIDLNLRRLGILVSLASASGARGDLPGALAAFEKAVELVPAGERHRVSLVAACASVEHGLGRFDNARQRLNDALAEVEAGQPAARATLQLELAISQLFIRDFRGALAWAERAAGEAADLPERVTARALGVFIRCSAEEFAAAEAEIDGVAADLDAASGGQRGRTRGHHLMAAYYLGAAEYLLGRYDRAHEHLQIATSAADVGGARIMVPALREMARTLIALGRLAEAGEAADMAVDMARIGRNDWLTGFSLAAAAEVFLARGDLPRTLDATQEAMRLTPPDAHHFRDGLRRQVALVHFEAGRPRACLEMLATTGAPEFAVVEPGTRWLMHETVARASVRIGDLKAAHGAIDRADKVAIEAGLTVARMSVARAQGELLLALGEPLRASDVLENAVWSGTAAGAVLETARTRVLAGKALIAAELPERAREVLADAEAVLRDAGAQLSRDAAARLLRQLGVSRPGRAAVAAIRGAATSGAALSAREREVAALVLSGSSNREIAGALFLSEKTVEAHLRRLYVKLGIRRRGALAAALGHHDNVGEPPT